MQTMLARLLINKENSLLSRKGKKSQEAIQAAGKEGRREKAPPSARPKYRPEKKNRVQLNVEKKKNSNPFGKRGGGKKNFTSFVTTRGIPFRKKRKGG